MYDDILHMIALVKYKLFTTPMILVMMLATIGGDDANLMLR